MALRKIYVYLLMDHQKRPVHQLNVPRQGVHAIKYSLDPAGLENCTVAKLRNQLGENRVLQHDNQLVKISGRLCKTCGISNGHFPSSQPGKKICELQCTTQFPDSLVTGILIA